MRCRALWLDLDYTLYDMGMYVELAFNDIAQALSERTGVLGREVFSAIQASFDKHGSMYGHLFDVALADLGLRSEENIKVCVSIYRNPPSLASKPLVAYADTFPLLAGVAGRCCVGILTNGNPDMQRRKIESLRLFDHVDHIVYASAFAPKPAVDAYLHAASLCGCSPEEMVYVGDNPCIDFSGAKRAGCGTVRVLRGEFMREQGNEEEIDLSVESLGGLCDILEFMPRQEGEAR
jgi:putative hydrolase of the HAD superfamily